MQNNNRSAFGGTRKGSCIMKCSNREKLSRKIATDTNSSIWMTFICRKRQSVPFHHTPIIRDTIRMLKWDLLLHPPYPPGLASSDFHFFRSMVHELTDLRLTNFEVQNWLEEWKDTSFYRCSLYVCVASKGCAPLYIVDVYVQRYDFVLEIQNLNRISQQK